MVPLETKEIVTQLKLQRDILREAGPGRPLRRAWKEERLFRDSLLCLNVDEDFEKHPCNKCLLWDWVPARHRYECIPCHFIPLDVHGNSIAALEAAGKRQEAGQALLEWLDSTIQKLEGQLEGSAVGSQS